DASRHVENLASLARSERPRAVPFAAVLRRMVSLSPNGSERHAGKTAAFAHVHHRSGRSIPGRAGPAVHRKILPRRAQTPHGAIGREHACGSALATGSGGLAGGRNAAQRDSEARKFRSANRVSLEVARLFHGKGGPGGFLRELGIVHGGESAGGAGECWP